MIRQATEDDLPELIKLAFEFAGESEQDRDLCTRQTKRTLEFHIEHTDSALFVADGSDRLAGVALCAIDSGFTKKPQALILVFYVSEPYRGTIVARNLIKSAVQFAKDHDCSHIWAGSNGLIGEHEAGQFDNLCAKFGFKNGGHTLYKVIQ
jgi:GNAT superfamily N-acetyltransferase